MEEVVYLILTRIKDTFKIIFVDQSQKTDDVGFFTKNDKFKCWVEQAGSEKNIFLAIYPMPNPDEKERKTIVNKTISKYNPICNQ